MRRGGLSVRALFGKHTPQADDVINFSCNKKYIPYLCNDNANIGNACCVIQLCF